MTETPGLLSKLFVLMSGEDNPEVIEDEIREATRELEAALETLRAARGGWMGAATVDVASIRRALDLAERQLDAARVRLEKMRARKG